jgi:hypothetical protein
MEPFVYLSPT